MCLIKNLNIVFDNISQTVTVQNVQHVSVSKICYLYLIQIQIQYIVFNTNIALQICSTESFYVVGKNNYLKGQSIIWHIMLGLHHVGNQNYDHQLCSLLAGSWLWLLKVMLLSLKHNDFCISNGPL